MSTPWGDPDFDVAADMRSRMTEIEGESWADRDEILAGPRLACGCPLDSGCDGRHPGALGAASGYDER